MAVTVPPRLVLSVFPGFAVGGAQMRFCAVANHFGPALRHRVVSLNGDLACRERLAPGLDVSFATPALPAGPLGRLRRIRTLLREAAADVLLTHNWGSIEWALANAAAWGGPGLRHLHVEDGFGPEERDRQLRRRILARRLALRRATTILPSRTLETIARQIWRLDPGRVVYLPNGIDLARFAAPAGALPKQAPPLEPPPLEPSPWETLAGDGPVVGTVATLRAEKNIPRLLAALARLPTLRGVIVGDGSERAALQAEAARLGVAGRVRFAGHLAEPWQAYRQFDIFALSSDTEQMPLSVLEAMAAGLPVAATDVGDVARMLAPANAPFVVPRNAAALADALDRLAGDAALRNGVGAANRIRVAEEYDQGRMLQAWGTLLGG